MNVGLITRQQFTGSNTTGCRRGARYWYILPANYQILKTAETTGGQIHTELSHYFVVQERVAYFSEARFRFYEFALSGQQGHPDQEINGTVLALSWSWSRILNFLILRDTWM